MLMKLILNNLKFKPTFKIDWRTFIRITIINLGLWKYCYDDQLYDLVEILNPLLPGKFFPISFYLVTILYLAPMYET